MVVGGSFSLNSFIKLCESQASKSSSFAPFAKHLRVVCKISFLIIYIQDLITEWFWASEETRKRIVPKTKKRKLGYLSI